jgi:peptidoglycan/LPS O-acetylase OafA/YrhL
MKSLDEQLESVRNHPSGFDYLRLFLAVSVILWHTIIVCYGLEAETSIWMGPLRPFCYAIVPAFFALSGFLVAGSLERNSISQFLALRVMRIFPALAVEVFISALIIGPIFTTESMQSYFGSNEFFSYFLNVIGDIHYKLPGVFSVLPWPDVVKLQLWTVPVELNCYLTITTLALIGVTKRPNMLALMTIGGALLITVIYCLGLRAQHVLNSRPANGVLILSFLFGVCLYKLRRRIPFNWAVCILSFAVYVVLVQDTRFLHLSAVPLAYVTIFIGCLNPRKTFPIVGADYSYGIYLYGFPLQQCVSSLLPSNRYWYVNAALSIPLAVFCAFLSWQSLESKILSRKKAILAYVSLWSEGLISRLSEGRLGGWQF